MKQKIKLYTLSTCIHCQNTKKFLDDCKADYTYVDVDLLTDNERYAVLKEIKKLSPEVAFPTIIIGDKVIVGFRQDEIKKALGI